MDQRSFNLIYESLLLEGMAGNIIDITMGMVLAEKSPTWLPVYTWAIQTFDHQLRSLSEEKES